MAKVVIENMSSKQITSNEPMVRLLDLLLTEVDWMHACGGKGRCTTCSATIVKGGQFLSEPTSAERNYVNLGRLGANQRLACQTFVNDDVVVRAPDANKLPHLKYDD